MKKVVISPEMKRYSIETVIWVVLMNADPDTHFRFDLAVLAVSDPETIREMRRARVWSRFLSFCRDGIILPRKEDDLTACFNCDGDVEYDKEFDISVEESKLFARWYDLDLSNDENDSQLYQSEEEHSVLRPVSVHVPPYEPSGDETDENDLWGLDIAEGLRADDEKKKAQLKKNIPGILPVTRIGKLVVKIAWEIEVDTGRKAACKEVMDRLCKLAATANESESINAEVDCLVGIETSDLGKESVVWLTEGGNEKPYGQDTCKQTLSNWRKSLPQKTLVRR